ncbi:MAG: metallophosphoesterase [Salinivirgaceae bacterium]|nr:metallophosphoesterase [Salinivirgaceae bacterium]
MIRFLQISDIHFSNQAGCDDDYAQMKSKFLEDIAKCYKEKGNIDYVLICGDIAYSGTDAQYKEARCFIDDICSSIGYSGENGENVFMVPGNHDKKRDVYTNARSLLREPLQKKDAVKKLLSSKVKEPMAVAILYAPFKQYYKMAADYTSISDIARKSAVFPESELESGRVTKFEPEDKMFWSELIGHLKGIPVTLHGSNTSLLSDEDDGESKSLIKGKHLQVLPKQAYNVTTKEDEIHILMLHHPMSEIIRGDEIEKDIDGRFQLQFYGHMHKQSSSCNNAVKIYSGALQPPEADEMDEDNEYFPVYNIIELEVEDEGGKPCLKVDVFSRKWDGVKFDEYEEETKTGKDALRVLLSENDSWKKTMERIRNGESTPDDHDKETETVYPHIVKRAFLHSDKQTKIIKEMYGDAFESISPNRNKYLTFLKRVEDDGRIKELNDILKRYGK